MKKQKIANEINFCLKILNLPTTKILPTSILKLKIALWPNFAYKIKFCLEIINTQKIAYKNMNLPTISECAHKSEANLKLPKELILPTKHDF